jgi:hypothetical protein
VKRSGKGNQYLSEIKKNHPDKNKGDYELKCFCKKSQSGKKVRLFFRRFFLHEAIGAQDAVFVFRDAFAAKIPAAVGAAGNGFSIAVVETLFSGDIVHFIE